MNLDEILYEEVSDTDHKLPPRRARRVKCGKCAVSSAMSKVPNGWIVEWDQEADTYTHCCPSCQTRRSKNR
jgi:hypothetical protein